MDSDCTWDGLAATRSGGDEKGWQSPSFGLGSPWQYGPPAHHGNSPYCALFASQLVRGMASSSSVLWPPGRTRPEINKRCIHNEYNRIRVIGCPASRAALLVRHRYSNPYIISLQHRTLSPPHRLLALFAGGYSPSAAIEFDDFR